MDRLTEHTRYIRIKNCGTTYGPKEREGAYFHNAIVRLAAYEDTGMTPDEIMALCDMDRRARMANLLRHEEYQALGPIDHLRELVEAERDGKLVVLPCRIGDTVYVISESQEKKNMKVVYIRSALNGEVLLEAECDDESEGCWCEGPCGVRFSADNMARRKIYLTRAEAEAALGGDENENS